MRTVSVAPTLGNSSTTRAPGERVAARLDEPVADIELGAHRLERREVHVELAAADVVAARHRDPGPPVAGEQRAEHVDRGAHPADELVGRLGREVGARRRCARRRRPAARPSRRSPGAARPSRRGRRPAVMLRSVVTPGASSAAAICLQPGVLGHPRHADRAREGRAGPHDGSAPSSEGTPDRSGRKPDFRRPGRRGAAARRTPRSPRACRRSAGRPLAPRPRRRSPSRDAGPDPAASHRSLRAPHRERRLRGDRGRRGRRPRPRGRSSATSDVGEADPRRPPRRRSAPRSTISSAPWPGRRAAAAAACRRGRGGCRTGARAARAGCRVRTTRRSHASASWSPAPNA